MGGTVAAVTEEVLGFSEEKIDLDSDVNDCKREEEQVRLQRQFFSHTFAP